MFVQCDDIQKPTEHHEDHEGNTPEDCCSDSTSLSVEMIKNQSVINNRSNDSLSVCYRCCPFLDIDTSQGAGRVWSNVKRACLLIVQHKYFEITIIIIIMLSSVALVSTNKPTFLNIIIKMVIYTLLYINVTVFSHILLYIPAFIYIIVCTNIIIQYLFAFLGNWSRYR